ncbi:restriction endonuclease subunit S [Morganella morganii]
MSELSYLEKLLNGVEVEWKPIGTEIKTVTAPSKLKSQSYRLTGRLPIIDQGLEFIAGYTDEDVTPINNGEYIIFGDHSEHIKYVDFPFVQGADGIKILRAISANTKYIYYAFLTFYTKELSYKRHWSTAQQTLIPIPCPNDPEKSWAIQSEIVRILDTFSTLTAELTAELTVRKKQYNYYRDQLLSFNDGEVEWKPLGEIGEVRMCKRILKSQTTSEGDIPFYKIGTFGKKPDAYISRSLFNEFKEKYTYPKSGEILISASGTIGRTVIFDGKESYFQDSNIVWIENDEKIILNKYLFYFYQIAKWEISEGGTIQRLYNENLRKLEIPVPFPRNPEKSLAEQARIVRILDKFDTLSTSITEGLPREIELRQKQYEYYRDLLFSFPKPESVNN